jgi:hypothetical protein
LKLKFAPLRGGLDLAAAIDDAFIMMRNTYVLILCGALLLSCNNATLGQNGTPTDLTGLISLQVNPGNLTLEATPTAPASQQYQAIGTFPDGTHDITSQTTFSVDNPGVGSFNQAMFLGSNQQGGATTVYAAAGTVTASASLVVHFSATVSVNPPSGQGNALPSNPSMSFQGTATAARAPTLVYPNNGVMLPPNIQDLEVHFLPGPTQNTLFQLSFQSNTTNVMTYIRCGTPVNSGCIFALDPMTYAYVANSNAGGQPVTLTVSGSDDNATGFGQSAQFQMQFAQQNVSGGLYYWTVSNGTGIMRVDFGSNVLTPTLFLSPGQNGFPTCVGCHAISRDGTKMVASLGGQDDGRLVYIANMAASAANLLTLNGTVAASTSNHIQFASFNPDGSQFVSVYGDSGGTSVENTLYFSDGTTGVRIPNQTIALSYQPDHPDWAPSGTTIAFTHVGIPQTSQRPFNCGVDMVQQTSGTWGQPSTVIPIVAGKSRYNPNFAPDSSFFTYSESTCPSGTSQDWDCDGDSDPSAITWAVLPQANAQPVLLAQASAPGVTDSGHTFTITDGSGTVRTYPKNYLSDTFPRFSPFNQTQGKGRLFWMTVSSFRNYGLRTPPPSATNGPPDRWLWMFAVDPDKIAAGQDGSYPAFCLPFQDLTTSNHIGQWTQKVVMAPG